MPQITSSGTCLHAKEFTSLHTRSTNENSPGEANEIVTYREKDWSIQREKNSWRWEMALVKRKRQTWVCYWKQENCLNFVCWWRIGAIVNRTSMHCCNKSSQQILETFSFFRWRVSDLVANMWMGKDEHRMWSKANDKKWLHSLDLRLVRIGTQFECHTWLSIISEWSLQTSQRILVSSV